MKKVNTLDDIQNKYPEERPLSENYDGKSLRGLYSENLIQISKGDFSNIDTIPGDFKVLFSIDGNLYGSEGFVNELRNSNNPYLNIDNIAIVELSSSELKSDIDFTNQEKYAEVTVTKSNGSSLESDLSDHIGWLLDSSTQELRRVLDYGAYNVETSIFDIETKTGLGFEYSNLIEDTEE